MAIGENEDWNPVKEYLKRRGRREPVPCRSCLEAVRNSQFSLYEVVDINPGRSLTLKDELRAGGICIAHDVESSRQLFKWDCIAARIVKNLGKNYIVGSILTYKPTTAELILKELRKLRKKELSRMRRMHRKTHGKRSMMPPVSEDELLGSMPIAQ